MNTDKWAALTLTLGGSASAQVMPCRYEIEHVIQSPCSGVGITAYGINDQKTPSIAGYYTCGFSTDKAFYWNENEGLVTLTPRPIGTTSEARDVNNNLQVVGNREFPYRGFVYQDGQYIVVPPLPGGVLSQTTRNTDTVVLGYREDPQQPNRTVSFIWEQGRFTDVYPTYMETLLFEDANSSLQVVGGQGNSTYNGHAAVWDNGVLTDLGVIPDGYTSYASDINERGQILINGQIKAEGYPFGLHQGYLYEDGIWMPMFEPPYDGSTLFDINNQSVIIGFLEGPFPIGGYFFVWQNGVYRDLQPLVPPDPTKPVMIPTAINEAGQILATTQLPPTYNFIPVLLTPVLPQAGDTNCDEVTDVEDLLTVILGWSQSPGGFADLDGNGTVDVDDLLTVLVNWG